MRLAVLVLLGFAAAACKPSSGAPIEDKVVEIGSDNAEMIAAHEKARQTLPAFWRLLEHAEGGESAFAVKVRLTEGAENEHFWLTEIVKKDGKISAKIDNEPQKVHNVRLDQRIEIREADIEDWTYLKGGKIYGNYTLRPLLGRMDPEEAKLLRQKLAEP